MKDDLETRLIEYVERWRAAQPEVPGLVGFSPPRQHWAGWAGPLAAAVAVAGVVVASITVATQNRSAPPPAATSSPTATPSHTQSATPVVPWVPLDPTNPTIPKITLPPSPDPTEADGLPPCQASDLTARSEADAATATLFVGVTFRNRGAPCSLAGRPTVQPLSDGRPLDIPIKALNGRFNYGFPVAVKRGGTATLRLFWSAEWCADPIHDVRLRLTLPHSGGSIVVKGFPGSPRCDAPPGHGERSPILVGRFNPPEFARQTVTSPYAAASVSVKVEAPASVTAGSRFTFEVVLTARRGDVVLDPCPDYTISQIADADEQAEESFSLNCAAVPYRSADGRPMLPDGVPVRFAMETTALGTVTPLAKFTWALNAPKAVPQSGERLSITPATPSASVT